MKNVGMFWFGFGILLLGGFITGLVMFAPESDIGKIALASGSGIIWFSGWTMGRAL